MADKTGIEWTDATWNPIVGCSIVSPGCTNCYAMKTAGTRLAHLPRYAGLTQPSKSGPVWNDEVRLVDEVLLQPLKWKRPRRIFVNSMSDLFHETVPDKWIDYIFAVMALAPQHTFQILTKRAERMRDYLTRDMRTFDIGFCETDIYTEIGRLPAGVYHGPTHRQETWPLPNVWIGVSCEDQTRADERIPYLLDTPGTVRFVSAEPLLGPLDLTPWIDGCLECNCGSRSGQTTPPNEERCHSCGFTGSITGEFCPECGHQDFGYVCPDCGEDMVQHHPGTPTVDWIIVGGESGPGARPMHPQWARDIRDQCAAAGTAFHFKQWGEWASILDRDNDDPDWRGDYTSLRDNGCAIINLNGGMGFHGEQVHVVQCVGKTRAGRLLDGVEHNEFPGG